MNTILLNAEDIKIGFRCLAELLLEGMKELDENQWFELGVNYGDEIGTKTLLSSNEKEDLIRLVLTDQCSQEEILKVGFDHVFQNLFIHPNRMPSPCSANCVKLFRKDITSPKAHSNRKKGTISLKRNIRVKDSISKMK